MHGWLPDEQESSSEQVQGMWRRRFSVGIGQDYFENTLTGETQFEEPEPDQGDGANSQNDTANTVGNVEAQLSETDQKSPLTEEFESARLPAELLPKIEKEYDGDVSKISDEWIEEQGLRPLQSRRLKALRAKVGGFLWFTGKTGKYDYWKNATTGEIRYMKPLGTNNYIMPAPKDYLSDFTESFDDSPTPSKAKGNWKRARAKIMSVQRIRKLAQASTQDILS